MQTNTNPLQQFHSRALQCKLSAGAILFWQQIYFTAQAQGKYRNLHIRTTELMTTLSLSRTGLQKIRRMLTDAGLLAVRVDARQQMYYTLMIDGVAIAENGENHRTEKAAKSKTKMTNLHGEEQTAGGGTGDPSPTAATDILQNNAYRKLVDVFCTQYDNGGATALSTRLQQFLYRRKQQGKTLTRAGLDALLDKLCALAQENVQTMIAIIEQSIQRGWYGFYPYRAAACNVSAGSGKAGNRHLERQSRIPKYDTKKEDLDFLEW